MNGEFPKFTSKVSTRLSKPGFQDFQYDESLFGDTPFFRELSFLMKGGAKTRDYQIFDVISIFDGSSFECCHVHRSNFLGKFHIMEVFASMEQMVLFYGSLTTPRIPTQKTKIFYSFTDSTMDLTVDLTDGVVLHRYELTYVYAYPGMVLLSGGSVTCYVMYDVCQHLGAEKTVDAIMDHFDNGDDVFLLIGNTDSLSTCCSIDWSVLLYHNFELLVPQSRKLERKEEAQLCQKPSTKPLPIRATTPPPYKAFGRIVSPKSSSESRKKKKNQDISERRLHKLAKLYPQGGWFPKLGIDDATRGTMSDINDNITNLLGQLPKFTDTVKETVSNGVDINLNFNSLLLALPQAVGILFTGYMAVKTREKKWIAGFIGVSALVTLANVDTCGDKLQKRFDDLLKRVSSPDLQPQAMDSDSFKTIAQVATVVSFGRSVSGGGMAKIFKGLSALADIGSLGNRIQDGLTFVVKILEKVINLFRDKVLGYGPIKLVNDIAPELRSWCTKVEKLIEESHKGRLAINSANAPRVFALQQEGRNLASKKCSVVDNAAFRASLATYTQSLNKLAAPFEQANIVEGGIRAEPYAILIKGKSGVGKSMAVTPTLKGLLKKVLPPEQKDELETNFMDFVYNRQAEHKYWDGYRSQFCTWCDDFGQVKDMAGNPDNEYMEVIRMVNITPNILHMADIASKGNNVFTSKIVIATTNLIEIRPESILEPDAVVRRFDIILELVPKQEWAVNNEVNPSIRRLDVKRLREIHGSAYVDANDISEFIVCNIDPATRQPIANGRTLSHRGVIELMAEQYTAKMERSQAYLEGIIQPASSASDVLDIFKSNLTSFVPQAGIEADEDKIEIELEDVEEDISSEIDLDELLAREDDNSIYQDYVEWLVRMTKIDKIRMLRKDTPYHDNLSRMEHAYMMARIAPKAFETSLKEGRHREYFARIIQSPRYDHIAELKVPIREMTPSRVVKMLKRARAVIEKALTLVGERAEIMDGKYPFLKIILSILGVASAVTAIFYKSGYVEWCADKSKEWQDKVASYFHGDKRMIPYGMPPECYRVDHAFEACEHGCYPDSEKERLTMLENLGAESGGQRKGHKKTNIKTKIVGLRPQSIDPNNDQMTSKIVRRSLYRLYYKDIEEGKHELGDILFVSGHLAIMPAHFKKQLEYLLKEGEIESGTIMYISNSSTKCEIEVALADILAAKIPSCWVDSDLSICEIKDSMLHPNGVNWFVSTNNALKATNFMLRIFSSRSDVNNEDFGTFVPGRFAEGLKVTNVFESEEKEWSVKKALTYHMATKAGDCGMLASIVHNSVGPGKICGMHVAGDSNNGVATVITSDEVKTAIALFDKQLDTPKEVMLMPQCMEVPFKGNFYPLAKTKDHGQSVQTKIIKSKLFESIGPSTHKPAKLARWRDDSGIRDPLVEAISRYGSKVKLVDRELLEQASDSYYSLLSNQNHRTRKPIVFTFEEACQGMQDVEFCNPIPRNTSAGYPYVIDPQPGYQGKEWYFGKDEKYDFTRPQAIQLKADVEEVIRLASKGERSFHVYVDTLKDETLKNAKVDMGKTRLVSAAPIVLTVVLRMYFLDFTMFLMEGNIDLGVGVGINAYSPTWDLLAIKLKHVGSDMIAGDYSGYDTTAEACEYESDCRVINKWYDDGLVNMKIREVLVADVTNSIHACRGIIYEWLKCMPSGVFLTTPLNCLRNQNNMRRCFMKLMPKQYSIADFDRTTKFVVYGDDLIGSVSHEIKPWFNQVTITEAMRQIGYTFTDEDKTGAVHIFRSLDDVSFLKRKFRFEPMVQRYVAPLSMDSIREMLYWTKKGANSDNVTRTNVDNALRELSLHGEEDFHHWAPLVVEASRKFLDYQPPVVRFRAWLAAAVRHEDHY